MEWDGVGRRVGRLWGRLERIGFVFMVPKLKDGRLTPSAFTTFHLVTQCRANGLSLLLLHIAKYEGRSHSPKSCVWVITRLDISDFNGQHQLLLWGAMNQDALAQEFRNEQAVRRTAFMLEAKRRRIRADLQQLIRHLSLFMPLQESHRSPQEQNALLRSAVERLDDQAFAELLQQILAEQSR